MPANKSENKYNIILIENDTTLFNKAKDILVNSQLSPAEPVLDEMKFEIIIVSPSKFLDYLEGKKIIPPSFVICVKDSDNIHKNIFIRSKEIIPETRRMLIAAPKERDEIIDLINNSDIHFCFIDPLDNQEFLQLIQTGLIGFKNGTNWDYIKRVVDEQNGRMYKLAKSLKEQGDKYSQIKLKRKEELERIQSGVDKTEGASNRDTPLEKYLSVNSISLTANDLKIGFKNLADKLKKLFDGMASNSLIDFKTEKYSDILSRKIKPETHGKYDGQIISDLLHYILKSDKPASNSDSIKELKLKTRKEKKWQRIVISEKKKDGEQNDAHEQTTRTEKGNSENLMELLEQALQFEMDEERLSMRVRIIKKDSDILTVENIFDYLRIAGASYGLINEQTLLTWLESKGSVQQLIVAAGTPPQQGEDGSVTYHFNTDFIHAGQVKPDGSIDFRERGSIPFVEENTLLAEKIAAKPGKPGIDISGAQIAVSEPVDPVFVAGDNTFESEGGLKIYAKTGGQPHLDAMGTVSVAPVLNIDSNVDFETGNISFKGSIVVSGTVKEGFKVEGTNLTAKQIVGAQINITGDLNISAGIIDSDIKALGNIQAKYINNTHVETFSNLMITTEVLDSKINLSGKFDGGKARIIGSEIIAKGGIEVGQIGTQGSTPVKLRVGVDDYILKLTSKVDAKLIEATSEIRRIKKDIEDLNKQDEKYFKSVTESAHIQDRSQLEIKDYKEKLVDLKESGNVSELKKIKSEIEQLGQKAKDAEKTVEKALDNQDRIEKEINVKKRQIEKLEEMNVGFVNEKRALKEQSDKGEAVPCVIVNNKVMAGTRVESTASSLTVRDDTSKCKIEEINMKAQGAADYYEMHLINL